MTTQALPRNLTELRQRDEAIKQAERRATVERIRAATDDDLGRLVCDRHPRCEGVDPFRHPNQRRITISAILDEEAAR